MVVVLPWSLSGSSAVFCHMDSISCMDSFIALQGYSWDGKWLRNWENRVDRNERALVWALV